MIHHIKLYRITTHFLSFSPVMYIFPPYLQVFPRTISGGLSAGAKAKEAKIKKERKADNVAEKKLTGKRVRKTVISEESEMKNAKNTNIAAFSAGDLIEEVEKEEVVEDVLSIVGEGGGEGEGELGELASETPSTADTPGSAPQPAPLLTLKSASRPGITSERIPNLFDPYVTGIAVRP
jgi:hypothetical protein